MTATLPPLTYGSFTTDEATQVKLYEDLLRPRLIEEKMLKQLRQGIISKWFSGIGQEAISVGCAAALNDDEYMFTMHRNLGVFTTRNVPLERLFAQWQGKPGGFTQGRDRSFHFGSQEHKIVGMISHLGPQMSLAAGVALRHKLMKEPKVSLAFTGDGGTSQGEFHEALNTAAVWKLPVLFVVENNGWGLSTPVSEQYACENLADRGVGYGMRSLVIDGNNVLEVYETVRQLAEEMRTNPEPVLLECRTFRVRGHEEASGVKYVPKDQIEAWTARDPLSNFATHLKEKGLLTGAKEKALTKKIKAEIDAGLKAAAAMPDTEGDVARELGDIYAPSTSTAPAAAPATPATRNPQPATVKRMIDAISDGLREGMRAHPDLVLMGQDIADYGGVFKITDGFMDEFGADRVRNTPLCESAIIGIGQGLSIAGGKAMVEMQFGDFVTCGFNQIVNNLAKLHYRWQQSADVTVRLPVGGGVGAGPYHSQTMEAWFTSVPGLKIVYPSSPADAKGLLLAALADPNPVLYFEHKALYRSLSGEVPAGNYHTEIGKAAVTRPGSALSIITYGMGVHWALKAVEATGIDAEILDLRSLAPLDYDAISATVKKTNRALILHEASLTGGFGGELAAWVGEYCFEDLDAPVRRLAALDTPVPFAAALEADYMPEGRLVGAMEELVAY
ncbi:alpha-ketoacid dehydrogenase subunit alpha/beta [Neolewinella agarilytica]|uniref:2-oxoisovalerate dehydrogenase E1 component n=1 Tax=Neolewinella agarilytica TaxID=478744 RepID=A0A1H9AGM8_9BACT|nr:alpha-ketoacid dehydrogenase subunit alpha/beta [Neolewinella agarilytica]SEP75860.1 2-oxoisovalerate dehydrogenase E1 component [Neolewinella agarilytica]